MDNDKTLLELCQKCLDALHRFKAVFRSTKGLPLEDARKIDNEDGERATEFYDAEVAPLMVLIGETPAVTIAGFAAKTKVFLFDDVYVTGSSPAEAACEQMLEDLAKLSPVIEAAPQQKAA